MASVRKVKRFIINSVCVLAIAAVAAWAIRERLNAPQRVAATAMTQAIDTAADEAAGIAGDVLGGDGAGRPAAKPRDVISGLFEMARKLSRQGSDVFDEMAGLTVEEEIEIGRDVHGMVATHHRLIEVSPAVDRIKKLARPFLESRSRKEISYHFFVLDDSTINAFAHVGGYVYVNQGLLDLVTCDEELAFVVGHEIAHGDLRHCAKGIAPAKRAAEVGGGLAGNLAAAAYQAIAVGYSEDQEFESDQWSYDQMVDNGWSHVQTLAGLRMLKAHCGDSGHEHDRPIAVEVVEDHFRTHPPVGERIKRLELGRTSASAR